MRASPAPRLPADGGAQPHGRESSSSSCSSYSEQDDDGAADDGSGAPPLLPPSAPASHRRPSAVLLCEPASAIDDARRAALNAIFARLPLRALRAACSVCKEYYAVASANDQLWESAVQPRKKRKKKQQQQQKEEFF